MRVLIGIAIGAWIGWNVPQPALVAKIGGVAAAYLDGLASQLERKPQTSPLLPMVPGYGIVKPLS